MVIEADSALVARIVAGKVGHFAEIVRRYDHQVRQIVARAERDPTRREDLVQQTFYQAFRRLADLATPERLEAWLVAIARHAVADAARRRSVRQRHERDLTDDEPALARSDRRDWIWDEVAQLAPIHRDVLELRYRDGMSWDEIGARLGVPRSTVRGRLYEGRATLRERLGDLA